MKIKLILLTMAASGLAACSSQPQYQPQAPLDMAAVQAYSNKVYSGNTVPASQRVKQPDEMDIPVNGSDRTAGQDRLNSGNKISRTGMVVVPTIGVGIGHRHHPYWW
ncbi:hypothetical protein RYD26_06915 [Pasteurellaceae bacterium LIM206]|nr:hypothetical protein [Pasteurellaceae bacterium LIM206]